MAQRYRARAPLRARAILALVATSVGSALSLAWVLHRLGFYGELPFLAPILSGLLLGWALSRVVAALELGRPLIVTGVSVLGALVLFVGDHLLDYWSYRQEELLQLEARQLRRASIGAEPADELARRATDERQEISPTSYLERRYGMDGRGSPADSIAGLLGAGPAIVLSGLELVLSMLATAAVSLSRATEPCCPVCGRWLTERPLATVQFGIADRFRERLCAGDIDQAVDLLSSPDTREETRLSIAECPVHHSSQVLRLRELRFERRNRHLASRHRVDLSVSQDELERLRSAVEELA